MNEQMLAEYCGWHYNDILCCWFPYKNACMSQSRVKLDFTTGNDWELILATIEEQGDWWKFYRWLQDNGHGDGFFAGCGFHEKRAAKKFAIFAQFLEEVEG